MPREPACSARIQFLIRVDRVVDSHPAKLSARNIQRCHVLAYEAKLWYSWQRRLEKHQRTRMKFNERYIRVTFLGNYLKSIRFETTDTYNPEKRFWYALYEYSKFPRASKWIALQVIGGWNVLPITSVEDIFQKFHFCFDSCPCPGINFKMKLHYRSRNVSEPGQFYVRRNKFKWHDNSTSINVNGELFALCKLELWDREPDVLTPRQTSRRTK